MPANQKAYRQRSFFDQTTQTRPSWSRNQNFSNASYQREYPKLTKPVVPIAASSQSKSKLGTFKFEQGENPTFNDTQLLVSEKENTTTMDDQDHTSPSQRTPQFSQKSAGTVFRECPQTPVGRLPLAELIASGEDINLHLQNLTPHERVLWYHSHQKEGQSSSQGANTGKKRRYSSSPASSSQNDTSNFFTSGNLSFDLQKLQKVLKTPQADPASDLWTRYSKPSPNTDKPSPIGLAGPSFALYSSPQTPAQHLSLRRSISCGTEWPTSIAKRRKIQHCSGHNVDVAGPKTEDGQKDRSKMARVSLLVDEIEHRLARPDVSEDEEVSGPPSSSPLAENINISTPSVPRSLHHSQPDRGHIASPPDHPVASSPDNLMRQPPMNPSDPWAEPRDSQGVFSDFDDDDLDQELLQTINEGAPACLSDLPGGLVTLKPRLELPHHGNDSNQSPSATSPVGAESMSQNKFTCTLSAAIPTKDDALGPATSPGRLRPAQSQLPEPDMGSNSDEFDEFDDFHAADLEDVAAMYDLQPQRPVQAQPAVQQHAQVAKSPRKSQVRSSRNEGVDAKGPTGPCIQGMADNEALSDDEFGAGLEFENIIAECEKASQRDGLASQLQSSNGPKASTIQRHLILTVAEGTYNNDNGAERDEKVLLVQNEKTKQKGAITLRGFWVESPCTAGSYVHLIGQFDRHGQCVVDDGHNLLIIHPDHLISATVVADSFSCTRRAVLQDRVKATTALSEPTLYGSMLHEIFQDAMKANRWDSDWLAATIEKVATRYLESLFEMDVAFEAAVQYLKTKAMDMQAWADVFVTARPKPNALVQDRNGAQALLSVNKLLDVEEKVWSPVYGLKGMVDATVQVLMRDGAQERTLTVPFELKTGKFPNAAHKAQTALYTLLLSDRYDVEILYGILYYTETSEISRIPAVRHELIHMVMQRNELACYVRHRLELPPMLKSLHLCGRCYAKSPCFLYHKLVDEGNAETSGMGEKFDEVTRHLKPIHQAFFQKWDDLITKEERVMMKFRRELWTMQSDERQKLGRCFGNVIIDPDSVHEDNQGPKINRFLYAFKKQGPSADFSFTESQITTGEPVVISDEKGHFALANGYVTKVQKQQIHVAVDRRLHNSRLRKSDFDAERNQVFGGIMEIVEQCGSGNPTVEPGEPEEALLYRIDKDEFSNGMALVRNNLIQLMEKDGFGAQALRALLIEGVEPTFISDPAPYTLANSASQASLNVDQKSAIEKVMHAQDYALVLGMPGTGKTTTIAHIIRALAAQGKSILLTSYTHTAVDNILLKIRDAGIGVFRLGNVAKVHAEVQAFAHLAGVPMKTVEEIKSAYSRQVVATTCLGISHPIFNQRVFDYCIVDEASQITLPVCLGPIRMARKFILVGDHYQLPPLVQNKDALEGGLDISLFKMLSDEHATSVVTLEHQYRMCEEIMTLSNTLVYNGRLKCGTAAVSQRTLSIPNINALNKHHHPRNSLSSKPSCPNPSRGSCWLRDLLDPSVKACLVNTDPLLPLSRESATGSRIINLCEATLCTHLVESLLTTGIPSSEIGVITLYRSQLALLKQNLRRHPSVEMHTADKFQGRDKEVIVLSLVRSNEARNVGDLLKDWRRVNVAFTRARSKLLIVGSVATIKGNELLERFVQLMDSRAWIYSLPPTAMEGHIWDEDQTATQQSPSSFSSSSPLVMMTSLLEPSCAAKQRNVLAEKNNITSLNNKKGKKQTSLLLPRKAGRVDAQRLISNRPVLRDIVNDAS